MNEHVKPCIYDVSEWFQGTERPGNWIFNVFVLSKMGVRAKRKGGEGEEIKT